MKLNQPTAIGLAVGALALAGGVIFWTINSNTIVAAPPIAAGTSAPSGAKPTVAPMNMTPGMSLSTPGSPSPGAMSPGSPTPMPGGISPGSPMPGH